MTTFRDLQDDKTLPYSARLSLSLRETHQPIARPCTETSPFQLGQSANVRERGAQLLADLTGVRNKYDGSDYAAVGIQRCNKSNSKLLQRLYSKNGPKNRHKTLNSRFGGQNLLNIRSLDPCDGHEALSMAVSLESPGSKNLSVRDTLRGKQTVEKAADTEDLRFWANTNDVVDMVNKQEDGSVDRESGNSSDISEELSRTSDRIPNQQKASYGVDNLDRANSWSCEEYTIRLKDSVNFLQMRTKMLQELCLANDSRNDSPVSVSSEGKSTSEKHRRQENDAPFTSSTSIVVKHARKLAGLIHVEEQAIDLRDLYQWLQHLGKLSAEDDNVDSAFLPSKQDTEALTSGCTVKDAEHEVHKVLNYSSTLLVALQEAQEDVCNRLANIYQEKNFMLCHQAELAAKKLLETQVGDSKEEKLQKYMEMLHHMEEGYELLGTTISQSFQDAEGLEEELQRLLHDLKAAETTGKSTGDSGLLDRRDSQLPDSVPLQVPCESTLEEKTKASRPPPPCQETTNQSVQTDEVLIISLNGHGGSKYAQDHKAIDIKVEEYLTKVSRQLQFWRTKNWTEKYEMQPQAMPAPVCKLFNQFSCGETPSDMGLLFYYNPQTGFHTMISASDLDPNVHQAILNLPARPLAGGQIRPHNHGTMTAHSTTLFGVL